MTNGLLGDSIHITGSSINNAQLFPRNGISYLHAPTLSSAFNIPIMHISLIIDKCSLVAQVPRRTDEKIIACRASRIEDVV
jgi:hypothetical protein